MNNTRTQHTQAYQRQIPEVEPCDVLVCNVDTAALSDSMAMGGAAGAAAGQMLRDEVAAAGVNTDRLRARLHQAGALVDADALPALEAGKEATT